MGLCLVLKGSVKVCACEPRESHVCAFTSELVSPLKRRKVSQLCVPVLHESCV